MEFPVTKMESMEDPTMTWEGEYHQIIQNPFGYPHQDDFSFEHYQLMHDRCLMNGRNETNSAYNNPYTSVVDSIASLGIRSPTTTNTTSAATHHHISTEFNGAETHLHSKPSHPPPISSSSSSSSSNCMISFGNPPSPNTTSHEQQLCYYDCLNSETSNNDGSVGGFDGRRPISNRRPPHGQDHVIAERKRREKLSQHFIALSALVPGLKKTDKASVLGDATKYIKHLQERVKSLEKQTSCSHNKTVEMVHYYVNRSQVLCMEDAACNSPSTNEENSKGRILCSNNNDDINNPSSSSCWSRGTLPEIEARVCDEEVMIRIHCERQKGSSSLAKLMSEIEKHQLNVVNTSVLPFGTSLLDITVLAHHHHLQMESGYMSSRMRHLVKTLQRVIVQ